MAKLYKTTKMEINNYSSKDKDKEQKKNFAAEKWRVSNGFSRLIAGALTWHCL